MKTTTLNRIRGHKPCADGWTRLLSYLGKTQADDEPLPYATIVKSNGLNDALWCCRAEPQYAREWRLFAVWCARQVQHLMTDPRSINALDVAERYANGKATTGELDAARAAAYAAAYAANAAANAANAAYAANAAANAANAAYAANAANAANAAANAANAANAAQTAQFLTIVGE